MAIPVAQAGADQDWASSTLPKAISLTGNGTNSPDSYRWTMLSVPPGSSANVGVNGNFTAGVSTTQNPTFTCDVIGGYVLQLEAHNGSGWSNPAIDKDGAQTIIYIKTAKLALKLPGYQQWRYDTDLNADLKSLETAVPTSDQTAALAGTSGTPSGANKYVTNADSRMTDGRTDANAIHKTTAAEISTLTEKTTPVSADLLIIEDSAASNAKKKVQVGNLPAGVDSTAIHKATAAEISVMTEKVTPVSADLVVIEDSAASYAKKKAQIGNLPGGSGGSPLTTKGDLYGFSTINARIPVGADGKTIVADSSQALGVKWASQVAAGLASDGVLKTTAALSADQTIVATIGGSSPTGMQPIPSTPLTLTFTTVANETVVVSFHALHQHNSAAGTAYVQLYLDGAAVGPNANHYTGATGAGSRVSNSYATTVATAGTHTLELRAAKWYADANWMLSSWTGTPAPSCPTQIQVTQFRGGYIQPENVPILKYNSATTIDVTAAPGADSQLRVMLTDGQRYISNAALTVNLTVSGRGGIDTGSEASSTWYYIFAVPATTSGQLAVVASVTAPGSGGPTGFSAWKYLGAIRNDGSSNILGFDQSGSLFLYRGRQAPAAGPGGTTEYGSGSTKVDVVVSDVIPATASFGRLEHTVQHSLTTGFTITQSIYRDGAAVSAPQSEVLCVNNAYQFNNSIVDMPFGAVRQIGYRCYDDDGGGTKILNQGLWAHGWTDGYLTQTVTQSQPMQILTGSNGTEMYRAKLAADQNIVAEIGSGQVLQPIPNTPLTLSFTTFSSEVVVVSYKALPYCASGSGTGYLQLWLDGAAVGPVSQFWYQNPSPQAQSISDGFPVTVSSGGTHTLELRAAKYTGSSTWQAASWSGNVSEDNPTQIRVTRFKGGYSQPDNVPILEYSSAGAVSIRSAPGAGGTLQVTLSDGIKYTAASPLTVSLSVSGRGGLDTGSESSSTWYYLYAVPPATVGGSFACVASAAAPSAGPTGFTAWKYLGAIRNDGSSNILQFKQWGDQFDYTAVWVSAFGASMAPDADVPVPISLSSQVPVTASSVKYQLVLNCLSGRSAELRMGPVNPPLHSMLDSGTDSSGGNAAAQFETPIVTAQTVWRNLRRTTGSGNIDWAEMLVTGWTDGYLNQTVTQSQPMQTLTGANGVSFSSYTLSTQRQITAQQPTFSPIPTEPVTVAVTTFAGEVVLVSFTGCFVYSGGANTGYLVVYLDGSPVGTLQQITQENSYAANLSDAFPVTVPTAGSHTFELRAACGGTNYPYLWGGVTQLRVTRLQGGYSNPDNTPILEYANASSISVKSAPGASSTLQVTLSDGQKYTAASPLTVNLTVSGRGGIDTGSEASSTWYYIFAVAPTTVGGSFSCVASASPPSTGPTGFTGWKYLGAIRNNSAGDILWFQQIGAATYYKNMWEPATSVALSTSAVALMAMSVADYVPATASAAYMFQRIVSSGGDCDQSILVDGETSLSTLFSRSAIGSQGTGVYGQCRDLVPMPNATKQINYSSSGTTITTQKFFVHGWIDGWLSQEAPQVQAKAVADTKLPRLTWVGNSSVTAAAAPGQPGTVRVTLQDGTQRSFTGTLTFDPSTGATDGGLDQGTEAVSTWYYLYLVPKSTDNTLLAIRGSVTGPATGPTGYTNWAYVGAVRNHSDGHLWEFKHVRDKFSYMYSHVFWNPTSPPADGSVVTMDISSVCPVTAGMFSVQLKVDTAASGQCYQLRVGGGVDFSHHAQAYSTSGGATTAMEECHLPLKTAQQIVRRLYLAAGSGNAGYAELSATGWYDDYLS